MTFKEAVQHVYAGTHDQKAIDTLKWYENNVIELEDYQTDELYKALEHIESIERNTAAINSINGGIIND